VPIARGHISKGRVLPNDLQERGIVGRAKAEPLLNRLLEKGSKKAPF
jgi:hypothetical protein